jgi:hypothetical protein
VPPRLDLVPYGRVAVVTFSSEAASDGLTSLATQRFAEALLTSQSGIELLELGGDTAYRRLGASGDDAALAQALGRDKDVPAVFVGHLTVSRVKPSGRIGGASVLNVRASVGAELTVRLLSTKTGGTVWRSSATTSRTVGQLGLGGGTPSVAVRNPDDAYDAVVGELVTDVTRDLRPTWVRR